MINQKVSFQNFGLTSAEGPKEKGKSGNLYSQQVHPFIRMIHWWISTKYVLLYNFAVARAEESGRWNIEWAVCMCRREHYTAWARWKGLWMGSRHRQNLREQPWNHVILVCLCTPGSQERILSIPECTHTQSQGSSYLAVWVSFYLSLSGVWGCRERLSVNVFMSVLLWWRATDSMRDDNKDKGGIGGQGDKEDGCSARSSRCFGQSWSPLLDRSALNPSFGIQPELFVFLSHFYILLLMHSVTY